MLLEKVDDAAGILPRVVTDEITVRALLVSPLLLVVAAGLGIVAAEKAVLEIVVLSHNNAGVGVVEDILLLVQLVLEDVVNHTAEERDIGAEVLENLGSTWISVAPLSLARRIHFMEIG